MTRRNIFIGLAVFAVLLLMVLQAIAPESSPPSLYSPTDSTSPSGLAAWHELLKRQGHSVKVEALSDEAKLPSSDSTVVLLGSSMDSAKLSKHEIQNLRAFVSDGGQLVVLTDDLQKSSVSKLVKTEIEDTAVAPTEYHPPEESETRAQTVLTDGDFAFSSTGDSTITLSNGDLVESTVFQEEDEGKLTLVADSSPLQNRLIDRADNAYFATELVGPKDRAVTFFVPTVATSAGDPDTGLAALPTNWKVLLLGLGLAVLLWLFAKAHRFGPPEKRQRDLPPPRKAFVEAQTLSLARTKQPGIVVAPLWQQTREELVRRCGLSPQSSDGELRNAAEYVGLGSEEVEALLTPPTESAENALLVAKAFATVTGRDQNHDNQKGEPVATTQPTN